MKFLIPLHIGQAYLNNKIVFKADEILDLGEDVKKYNGWTDLTITYRRTVTSSSYANIYIKVTDGIEPYTSDNISLRYNKTRQYTETLRIPKGNVEVWVPGRSEFTYAAKFNIQDDDSSIYIYFGSTNEITLEKTSNFT